MKEHILTDADLKELDLLIDSEIPKAELSKFDKDTAILSSLLAFELNSGYGTEYDSNDPRFSNEHQKNCQDAVHFLIDWCYRFCEDREVGDFNKFDYGAFLSLLEIANNYSVVWDLLSQLQRGWTKATRTGSEIHISDLPELVPGGAIGDLLLFSPDPPDLEAEIRFDLEALLTQACPTGIKTTRFLHGTNLHYHRFQYTLPARLVSQYVAARECLLTHLWVYDPTISVGQYTFAEFREFWRYLTAYAELHRQLCSRAWSIGVVNDALLDLIIVKSPKEWIRELSRLSALPTNKIKEIILDLTFSPLKKEGQKRLDVTHQPFLPLSGDRLCLSPLLALRSNAEANLWTLKIGRNTDFSRHTDTKESQWLMKLSEFLEPLGIVCVPFNVPTGHGDVDIVLWDPKDNFAIAAQLKSHQPPDRLNEVAQEIKELQKGISQVEKALAWISDNQDSAQARLSALKLKDLTLKGLVLTSGTTGGGLVKHKDIPITGDRLLKWVVGSPGHGNLRTFWQIASEPSRYVPKMGEHYLEVPLEVEFANVKFVSKAGVQILKEWLPSEDIQF